MHNIILCVYVREYKSTCIIYYVLDFSRLLELVFTAGMILSSYMLYENFFKNSRSAYHILYTHNNVLQVGRRRAGKQFHGNNNIIISRRDTRHCARVLCPHQICISAITKNASPRRSYYVVIVFLCILTTQST